MCCRRSGHLCASSGSGELPALAPAHSRSALQLQTVAHCDQTCAAVCLLALSSRKAVLRLPHWAYARALKLWRPRAAVATASAALCRSERER